MKESGGGGLECRQPPEEMEMRLTFKGDNAKGKSERVPRSCCNIVTKVFPDTSPTRSETNYPGTGKRKSDRGRSYFMGKDCEQDAAKAGSSTQASPPSNSYSREDIGFEIASRGNAASLHFGHPSEGSQTEGVLLAIGPNIFTS